MDGEVCIITIARVERVLLAYIGFTDIQDYYCLSLLDFKAKLARIVAKQY